MCTTAKISRRCREDFSGRSTGNDHGEYYDTKGHAINAFDAALNDHGYHLDLNQFVDYNGPTGRANHDVLDGDNKVVGCAIFSWYRMDSGRYEFIGYLA